MTATYRDIPALLRDREPPMRIDGEDGEGPQRVLERAGTRKGDYRPNRADALIWALTELFPGIVSQKREKKEPVEFNHWIGEQSWMN